MEADIVADPDAVVVEFISTSITSLAMLCIHKHVRIAQITVETIIVLVEVNQGHLVPDHISIGPAFLGHPVVSVN